jgi:RHS repeat-associated protein
LGSVRQLLDTTGQIEANYAYDPFGVPLVEGEVYNPYQYTGEAWDGEVGLLYLRARYYQPEVGRFVTRDAWGGDVWRPATLNRYVYVRNNAVNLGDSSGLDNQPPEYATPTPTLKHLQGQIEEGWEEVFGEPYPSVPLLTAENSCTECVGRGSDPLGLQDLELPHRSRQGCAVRAIPCALLSQETAPTWEIRAQNPGTGLLFQGSAVYPPRKVWFRSQAFGGASLDSGLEASVRIYMNGAHVEVLDTFDTADMASVGYLPEFPGMMYRYGRVTTTHGEGTNFYFRTVERHNAFNVPVEQGPLDLIPPWQRGKGEAIAWVPRDEGLAVPAKIRLVWGITTSRYVSGPVFDVMPELGAESYDVSLQQVYGDLRIDKCPP